MADRDWDPAKVARGHIRSEASRKAVIILDDETFEEIRARAIAARTSFAAECRSVIEVGLETLKQT